MYNINRGAFILTPTTTNRNTIKVLIHKPLKSDNVKNVIIFFIGKILFKYPVNPMPRRTPKGINVKNLS